MKIHFPALQRAVIAVAKNDHPNFEDIEHVEQGHLLAHYFLVVGSFIHDLPEGTTSETFQETKEEFRTTFLQKSFKQVDEIKRAVAKITPGLQVPDDFPVDDFVKAVDSFLGKMQIAVDSIESTETLTNMIDNFGDINLDEELKKLVKDNND